MTILEAEDPAKPDTAASTGTLDLYDAAEGRVGIDACLPDAVATKMVRAAVGLDHIGLKLSSVAGNTSFQAEVHPGDVAALLAPAKRAGVKIIDDRDVAQPRNGGSV
jgi:hypothetical protein